MLLSLSFFCGDSVNHNGTRLTTKAKERSKMWLVCDDGMIAHAATKTGVMVVGTTNRIHEREHKDKHKGNKPSTCVFLFFLFNIIV